MNWEERMGASAYAMYQSEFSPAPAFLKRDAPDLRFQGRTWGELTESEKRSWGRIARAAIERANSEDNPRESRMK